MYAQMKVCEDVCPHLYVLMCTCMGRPEDNLRCRSQEHCPPPLRQGFTFGLELNNQTRLLTKGSLRSLCLCLPSIRITELTQLGWLQDS